MTKFIIANHQPKREKCGISTYAQNLYDQSKYSETPIDLVPFDTKLAQLFWLIFKKFNIVHFQHEFGIWPLMGLSFLIYLVIFRLLNLLSSKKVVVTMHTVWDLSKVEIIFAHYSPLFRSVIKYYLQTSYWIILNFSHKILVLNPESVQLLKSSIKPLGTSKVEYLEHGLFRSTDDKSALNLATMNSLRESESTQKIAKDVKQRVKEIQKSKQSNLEILNDKYNISVSDKLIVMFGFTYPSKGFHLVIEALPEILKLVPEAKVVIAGSSPQDGGQDYLNKLVSLSQSLNIQDKIIFTGFLESGDKVLQAIFKSACCFVYPYFERSGASGSIATVFDYKKPILVSQISFFQDFDFLPKFKEGDVEDLTVKLVQLLLISSVHPTYQKYLADMNDYFNQHSISKSFQTQLKIFQTL